MQNLKINTRAYVDGDIDAVMDEFEAAHGFRLYFTVLRPHDAIDGQSPTHMIVKTTDSDVARAQAVIDEVERRAGVLIDSTIAEPQLALF
ncbi:hypothetical protein J1771_gp03 [Gordonia phage MelBins]|uniref:Uncharacterized protein n=1 Tax=Gordonia phage MelBins TaxID=2656540 RepID=A0A649VMC8_9CAUD|nr:hypothetical protein J1771_gp03 [Gordonia phage MelBins]QGJ93557.1 hypothetical protein SEA_MELBINS_3 [Gordonia phage MelBins]